MTESFITGGTVAIEDGVKAKEEFAPARKAKVEISFSVPEGGEGQKYLNAVTDIVNDKVQEILGRAPAAKAAVTEKPAKATTKKPAADTGKTKADLAKEAGVPASDTVHKGPVQTDVEDLTGDPGTAGKIADAPKDDLDDLLGDTAPVPITDAELGKAAQEKNGKMKAVAGWAPAKIRALVAEFAGEGKRINDIPAAKRKEFLDKLEALK